MSIFMTLAAVLGMAPPPSIPEVEFPALEPTIEKRIMPLGMTKDYRLTTARAYRMTIDRVALRTFEDVATEARKGARLLDQAERFNHYLDELNIQFDVASLTSGPGTSYSPGGGIGLSLPGEKVVLFSKTFPIDGDTYFSGGSPGISFVGEQTVSIPFAEMDGLTYTLKKVTYFLIFSPGGTQAPKTVADAKNAIFQTPAGTGMPGGALNLELEVTGPGLAQPVSRLLQVDYVSAP